MVQDVMNRRSYDHLCQPYDFSRYEGNHGRVHMWINGHMASLPCAPCDPMFWSHHCFVDKLGEGLRDRLADSQFVYPTNSWRIPWRHRPRDPMRPFNFRNEDGMFDDRIGKEYFYEASPMDEPCGRHADCSPTGLLWCDNGECKATCREGGVCNTGMHDSCYCASGIPRCENGNCGCT